MTYPSTPGWTPAPRPGLVPLYPYGFGTILGASFRVLKGNPKVLLLFVVGVQTLAMVLFLAAIGGISFAAFSRADTVSPTSPEFEQLMWGATAIVLIASLVMAFALAAVTILAQGVVVAEVAHAALGERAPLSRLWRRVGPAFWRLFGYSLLVALATTLALALLAVPAVALALVNTPPAWVAFVFVILAAILGGFVVYAWLGTKLFLVPSAIVLEGAGPIAGIRRSWALTRGRFWATFGVVAILAVITNTAAGVVSGLGSLVSQIVIGLFIPFAAGAGGEPSAAAIAGSLGVSFLVSLFSFVVSAVLTIVLSAGGALTYLDARMRDEGIDLRMQRYVESGGASGDPYTVERDRAAADPAGGAPMYAAPSPVAARTPTPAPSAYPEPLPPRPAPQSGPGTWAPPAPPT
ncbi:hypothetical protein [Microbacterium sp. ZXX196]|uniref:DUF7544 domain-containing protein n=1 Tax=Microbacterium sp. ZXX196 TaxID=2609291 RepID=UPI0012B9E856|nr:hypothetical protein [Microbacterium sp. ZXX196]MTE22762.1 hypothetical protein [Microbacterium sp. ZXX196]